MLFKLRDAKKVVLDSPVKVKRAVQCLPLILIATFPIPRIMCRSSLFGHLTRILKESHGGVWHHRTVAFKDQVRMNLFIFSYPLTLFISVPCNYFDFTEVIFNDACDISNDEAWRRFREEDVIAPMYSKPHYADAGYAIIGRALESVLGGQKYEDFVMNEIFKPLGKPPQLRWT